MPNVLNLDHVFAVDGKADPEFADQLQRSPVTAFAETADRSGAFRFSKLQSADDPLDEMRSALNFVPFTDLPDTEGMDSAINGFGFADLLQARERPLVVILNTGPTNGSPGSDGRSDLHGIVGGRENRTTLLEAPQAAALGLSTTAKRRSPT